MTKFEIRRSADELYYWVAVAENGEVRATSETYTRKQGARDGVESFADEAEMGVYEVVDCTDPNEW